MNMKNRCIVALTKCDEVASKKINTYLLWFICRYVVDRVSNKDEDLKDYFGVVALVNRDTEE